MIDAPIGVIDLGKGLRGVKKGGKDAQSRFKFISYDEASDTSLISCFPITGYVIELFILFFF